MAKSLVIRQTKSASKMSEPQRKTLKALGLRGRGSEVARTDLRAVRGMLNKVHHVVQVEQVDGPLQLKKQNEKKAEFEIIK